MKKFRFSFAALVMLAFVGLTSCTGIEDTPVISDEPEPEPVPVLPKGDFELVDEYTSLEEIGAEPFVIANLDDQMAFYGPDAQNLAYGDIPEALKKTNANIAFKLEAIEGGYLLRAITPAGEEYSIWGSPGYLNAQPLETGWCCFILGLNNQNGQDFENGAVWDIQYVDGQGFAVKNIGTGKYLKDAGNANQDEPTYFSFFSYQEAEAAE